MSRILIYPDAAPSSGAGHITRCAALAKELVEFQADVTLVCRSDNKQAIAYFRALDLCVQELASRGPVVHDLRELANYSHKQADIDWLVVDNYAVDSSWLLGVRTVANKIAVIDDLANRRLDCDLVVNQNLGFREQDYSGLISSSTACLVGPRFALLRKTFKDSRSFKVRTRNGVVKRILVFFGAADPNDNARRTLNALAQLEQRDYLVDFVLGPNYEDLDGLKEAVEKASINAVVHASVNAQEMADLMRTADVCIGASGSANWERCCLGLPTLLMVIADNQLKVADVLNEGGYAVSLGRDTSVSLNELKKAIQRFISDPDQLKEMSKRASALIDGQGCTRVAKFMLAN